MHVGGLCTVVKPSLLEAVNVVGWGSRVCECQASDDPGTVLYEPISPLYSVVRLPTEGPVVPFWKYGSSSC